MIPQIGKTRLGLFGLVELALKFAHFLAVGLRIINAELLSSRVFFRILFLDLAGNAGSTCAALLAALTEAALTAGTLAAETAEALTSLALRTLAAKALTALPEAALTLRTLAALTEAALTLRTLAALAEAALTTLPLTTRTLAACGGTNSGSSGRKIAGLTTGSRNAALTIRAALPLLSGRTLATTHATGGSNTRASAGCAAEAAETAHCRCAAAEAAETAHCGCAASAGCAADRSLRGKRCCE